MSTDIPVTCACGSFKAVLKDASDSRSNHGICYCSDCQAFARHMGKFGKVTDAAGGTEIYQIDPSHVRFLEGAENLALMRLSPNGLFRWYAKCCNTPLFNTPSNPKIPFVGVLAANLDAPEGALGPVRFRYKIDQAAGPVEGPAGSVVGFVARTMKNLAAARLSGRWAQSPFFEAEGLGPVREPQVISLEERKAAYGEA